MKKALSIIFFFILLVGCLPSEESVQTMSVATQSALSSKTIILVPTTTQQSTPSITPTLFIDSAPPSEPYTHLVRAVYALGTYTFNEVSTFGHYIVGRITSADLNIDGKPDLILASEENHSLIQVYENLGKGVFRNSGAVFPFYSSDNRHWNFGITIADFNHDGLPDIATADAWAGLNIYFNEGKFRFSLAQRYTFPGMVEVKGIAGVDLNRDTYPDIILGDHNGLGGTRVLINDGTGLMIDSGQTINKGDITWDVSPIITDQEGAPDFISINRYAQQPARMSINNGNGIINRTIDIPESLDDSFGLQCISFRNYTYCAIANANATPNSQRLNRFLSFNQTGDLVINKTFGDVSAGTMAFCFADINSDGFPDLVSGNLNKNSVVDFLILSEDGLLEFTDNMPLFNIPRTSFLDCADYSGDGLIDILVGLADDGAIIRDYHLLIQQPLGSPRSIPVITMTPTNSPTPMGKTIPDPLFKQTDALEPFQATNTERVALGDFNGDGSLDLVEGNGGELSQPLVVYFNNGQGKFLGSNQLFPASQLSDVELGDIDRDGDLDMVVANAVGGITTWINDGYGKFLGSQVSQDNFGISDLGLADLNGDGIIDFLAATGGGTLVYFNNGDNIFMNSGQSLGNSDIRSLAIGDVNNDGAPDFVQGNSPSSDLANNNQIFLNDGNGYFTGSGLPPGTSDTFAVALADLNRDSFLDLIFGNSSDAANDVFFNNGKGHFFYQYSFGQKGNETKGLGIYDLNNDGFIDAATGDWNGGIRVYINDGTGGLTQFGNSLGVDRTNDMTIGDVNGDFNSDIISAVKQAPDVLFINQIGSYRNNTSPQPPSELQASFGQSSVSLSWKAGQDQETPTNILRYILRVGTTPGGNQIVSGKLPAGEGNTGQLLGRVITNIKPGRYYWSVKTIDSGFALSGWTEEHSFVIP